MIFNTQQQEVSHATSKAHTTNFEGTVSSLDVQSFYLILFTLWFFV